MRPTCNRTYASAVVRTPCLSNIEIQMPFRPLVIVRPNEWTRNLDIVLSAIWPRTISRGPSWIDWDRQENWLLELSSILLFKSPIRPCLNHDHLQSMYITPICLQILSDISSEVKFHLNGFFHPKETEKIYHVGQPSPLK